MNTFLDNLASRLLDPARTLQPRTRSRFEPEAAASAFSSEEGETWAGETWTERTAPPAPSWPRAPHPAGPASAPALIRPQREAEPEPGTEPQAVRLQPVTHPAGSPGPVTDGNAPSPEAFPSDAEAPPPEARQEAAPPTDAPLPALTVPRAARPTAPPSEKTAFASAESSAVRQVAEQQPPARESPARETVFPPMVQAVYKQVAQGRQATQSSADFSAREEAPTDPQETPALAESMAARPAPARVTRAPAELQSRAEARVWINPSGRAEYLPPAAAPMRESLASPLPDEPALAPTVQVTIGRIEIRAAAPAPRPAAGPRPSPTTLTLAQYLRDGEGRR